MNFKTIYMHIDMQISCRHYLKFYFSHISLISFPIFEIKAFTAMFSWSRIKTKSLKLPNNEYFSIYIQISKNYGKLNCFSRIMDKYLSAPDSVCTTCVKKILVTMFAWSLFMLNVLKSGGWGGPVCNDMSLKYLKYLQCGA